MTLVMFRCTMAAVVDSFNELAVGNNQVNNVANGMSVVGAMNGPQHKSGFAGYHQDFFQNEVIQ